MNCSLRRSSALTRACVLLGATALAAPALAQSTPPIATPGASPSSAVQSTTTAAPTTAAPTTAPTAASPAAPAAPATWASTITLGAQFEAGIIANPARPADGENYGDIYTDHANQVQLNQILLTATRPTDANAKGYDFGFTLQGLYGSDMRANHYLGQFDSAISSRYQFGITQANLLIHLPWFTSGGVDAKVGEFPSIMGLEVLDPSQNPFYTHSFIYNWGVTFFHTGFITITHVNPTIDVYFGLDTGNTTTFGRGAGDNNSAPAGNIGLGLNNLFGGKVTVLATAHIGPETSTKIDPNGNADERYYSDILTTWKINSKLTSNTELNYIKDDFLRSNGYGFAQYFSYPITPTLTGNFRGEVWRDGGGLTFNTPDDLGFVKGEAGDPVATIVAPPTTYGELTVGVTYKPPVPKAIALLAIRPEIRYERSLNGTQPFDAGRDTGSFLFGGDVILGF